jgi:hypothetical protein
MAALNPPDSPRDLEVRGPSAPTYAGRLDGWTAGPLCGWKSRVAGPLCIPQMVMTLLPNCRGPIMNEMQLRNKKVATTPLRVMATFANLLPELPVRFPVQA